MNGVGAAALRSKVPPEGMDMNTEILPQRIGAVIDDIEECVSGLVRTCKLLEDVIIVLSTPIIVMGKKNDKSYT